MAANLEELARRAAALGTQQQLPTLDLNLNGRVVKLPLVGSAVAIVTDEALEIIANAVANKVIAKLDARDAAAAAAEAPPS